MYIINRIDKIMICSKQTILDNEYEDRYDIPFDKFKDRNDTLCEYKDRHTHTKFEDQPYPLLIKF